MCLIELRLGNKIDIFRALNSSIPTIHNFFFHQPRARFGPSNKEGERERRENKSSKLSILIARFFGPHPRLVKSFKSEKYVISSWKRFFLLQQNPRIYHNISDPVKRASLKASLYIESLYTRIENVTILQFRIIHILLILRCGLKKIEKKERVSIRKYWEREREIWKKGCRSGMHLIILQPLMNCWAKCISLRTFRLLFFLCTIIPII